MHDNYEEIVKNWYKKLQPDFLANLMTRYKDTRMTLQDAENIYQDVFIAIHENLENGSIRENTSWRSYIMKVGMNMASKNFRTKQREQPLYTHSQENEDSPEILAKRVSEMLQSLEEEEHDIYSDPESTEILSDELTHTPEPCASIIRLTYYSNLTDKEITEELDRYNSTQAVKSKRYQCMKDLIFRVKMSLYNAGIINNKPERR